MFPLQQMKLKYFGGDGIVLVCCECRTHFARTTSVVSRLFQGQSGPASLLSHVINCKVGKNELDRYMTTGRHLIRELYCACCDQEVGWTYVRAFEQDQKYKEGKFIIEHAYILEADNTEVCGLPASAFSKGGLTRLNYFRVKQA